MKRLLLLVITTIVVIAATPWIGARPEGEAGSFILNELRIPRTLMAAMVGGLLSMVGAVYQTLFANPLAAPSTVGTTAGAVLGALVALVLGWGTSVSGLPAVATAAFCGALVVTFLLAGLAAREQARIDDVLLMGVAISLAAGAISAGIQFTSDQVGLANVVRWTLGHLPQVGYKGIYLILPFFLLVVAVLLSQVRSLESLVAGEQLAFSQGVDVRRTRVLGLGVGALGVSAVVAWCGPIAFVGLIVPHITRRLLGTSRRLLIPGSLFCGSLFLVLCDLIGRSAIPGKEVPVGVITAALGAPTLIALIIRRRP